MLLSNGSLQASPQSQVQTPESRITILNLAWCVAAAHNMYVPNAKPTSPRVCIGDVHIVSCRHDVGFRFEARA